MKQTEQEKYTKLQNYFQELGNCVVAFSGGVDSALLAKTAHDILGSQMVAVTATSNIFPKREREEAIAFCKQYGIPHKLIAFDPFKLPGFEANPNNRCYICKHHLLETFQEFAKQNGYTYVCEGSNMDDLGDYRPGLQAVSELGILSPLRHVKLHKAEIRNLSKALDIPTWNKSSFACLASRFVYGEHITREHLERIDQAEQLLYSLGFTQFRVRIHGGTNARIELLPQEFSKLMETEIRELVYTRFQALGFQYVTLDLQGYRTGSMNETLSQDNKD